MKESVMLADDRRAPDQPHPEYLAALPLWRKCRDVAQGQEAVHKRGEAYLPRLEGQGDDDYRAYLGRALFYNATQRTIDGLRGLMFRKPPLVTAPSGLGDLVDDLTGFGEPLQAVAETIAGEVLTVGRMGLLVDFPAAAPDVVTRAEAEAGGRRPFWALYGTEDIVNWRIGRVAGRASLTRVVLSENGDGEEGGARLRVLEIDDDGIYRQRLYVRAAEGPDAGRWSLAGEIEPVMDGEPLTRIPFVFFGSRSARADVGKPPLLDLVNVNLSHYRTTADLEHGAHYTGLPTPVVSGQRLGDDEALAIGAGEAWVLESKDARAYYLEFRGEGLGVLERLLDRKEGQMAALGARMLAPEKRAAETAETAGLRRMGENSALAAMAQSLSLGLTRALAFTRDWAGLGGDVSVEINRDYLPRPMDAQALTALVEAWQKGALGFTDLHRNLVRGEVIAPDRDAEAVRRDASAAPD